MEKAVNRGRKASSSSRGSSAMGWIQTPPGLTLSRSLLGPAKMLHGAPTGRKYQAQEAT